MSRGRHSASVRAFWASVPSHSKHTNSVPELQHTLQQLPGAFLSCPQSLLRRWGCSARVKHERWHVAERCKMLIAHQPHDFVCGLSKEDIVQPLCCACAVLLQWSWRKQMSCLTQHWQCSCHSLLRQCCSCLSEGFAGSPHTCRDGHVVLRQSVKRVF